MNHVKNCGTYGGRITSLLMVNELDSPLVLAGFDDGIVKVWSGLEEGGSFTPVSAWRAVPNIPNASIPSSLLCSYMKYKKNLIIAGDVTAIRIWDLEMELCAQDIAIRTASLVSAVCCGRDESNVFAVGFADGAIQTFDCREPTQGHQHAFDLVGHDGKHTQFFLYTI